MPLNLLKEIIRTRGSTISDFLQRKVAQPVASLKEGAERKVDEIVRRSETTVEEKTKQVRDFFTNTQKTLDDLRKNLDDRLHTLVSAFGSRAQMREQLSELKKRIEEIENRLK
jgi:polyhydroxyalkanoate synthesis regulator phasin